MDYDPLLDSLDDIISVLNTKKDGNTVSLTNLNTIPESLSMSVQEIGDILNDKDNKNYKEFDAFKEDELDKKKPTASKSENTTTNSEIDKLGLVLDQQEESKTLTATQSKNIEQNLTIHPRLTLVSSNKIRYMRFKPFFGSLEKKSTQLSDRGYYFKFINADIKIIRAVLEDNGFIEIDKGFDFSILWCIGPIKSDIYQCLSFYQKVNHFPKSHEITRKDNMHRNIFRMQITHGLKNFNFIPKTFILPSETPLLIEDVEKRKGKLYIVKPQGASQGRGIFITDKIQEILQKQSSGFVVSHYIDDPYLIEGYKFDLRIYVAITSIHPLRIYIYEEGLARFATEKYNKDQITKGNRFMHLTNYSINKHSDGLVFEDVDHEDQASCKWSLFAFRKYLREHNVDVGGMFAQIEDLIIKTIVSVEGIIINAMTMQAPHRTNSFELLGFDVLIDSQLKPWLLEVNLSPSLACETSLDQRIKSELMADLFTLIGIVPNDQRVNQDPVFSKNYNVYLHGIQPNQIEKRSATNAYSLSKRLDDLTKEEKAILRETNDEYERRGKFKRIYPNPNTIEYRMFFTGERPYNDLLRAIVKENLKTKLPTSISNLATGTRSAKLSASGSRLFN